MFAPRKYDSYITVFTNNNVSEEAHHIVVGLFPLESIKLVKISVFICNFDTLIITNHTIIDIIL